MSDQWPEPIYVDGNFDVAEPIGLPVFSSPLRSTTAEYTFTQDWMMRRKRFAPTPLNTAHPSYRQFPDYSDFKLVAEGPRQDVGGGMVKWSRYQAKVNPTERRSWMSPNSQPESSKSASRGGAGRPVVGAPSAASGRTGDPETATRRRAARAGVRR